MDIKLTKKRLNDHLSYDWWKYLAVIVASIFLWSLLFTMTAPRLASSKKLEIFFIVNGFSHDNSNKLRNGLREYLSDEFVEIHFNNYNPGDSVTAQVLTARLSVKEGDLYTFPFSNEPNINTMGSYIDNGLFIDFESIIADAIEFGDSALDFEGFKVQYQNSKEYNTEEKLQNGFEIYINTRQRAKAEALKLQGFIADYGADENTETALFYKYSRFEVYKELYPQENLTVQSEKIWGINFNALFDKITNFNQNGFMFPNPADITTGKREPFNYSLGIVSFKEENMPLYYENIAVINYFIETYYI